VVGLWDFSAVFGGLRQAARPSSFIAAEQHGRWALNSELDHRGELGRRGELSPDGEFR